MTAERQLVAAMREGDSRAFDAFFHDFAPRLYRFVLPRVDGQIAIAEDVCQTVLARAMQKIGHWRGEATLFTWLCQIARNEITDYWRRDRHRSRHEVLVEDDPDVSAALDTIEADATSRPELATQRDELKRLVQVALDRLPASYGDALELKYIEGHSTVEIARRQGLTPLAAQSLLQRARGAFRDAFSSLTGASLSDALPFVPKVDSHE